MKYGPVEQRKQNTYQTGSMKPPKQKQSTVAMLLVMILFSGGLFSALGVMNGLSRKDSEEELSKGLNFSWETPMDNFSAADVDVSVLKNDFSTLGMQANSTSRLLRKLHNWPEGLYISQVEPAGPADLADIHNGDLLLEIDGIPVTTEEGYAMLVSALHTGQRILVTVYRKGCQIKLPLVVGEDIS